MIKIRFTLLWVFTLFVSLAAFAQPGADPAVTNRDLQPAPLANVGSPFSLTFTIGNNGTAAISGQGFLNKMQWEICLGKCAPSTGSGNETASLSGPLLSYFDVTFAAPESTTSSQGGCFVAIQKQGAVLDPTSLYNVVISAVVTKASTSTAVNDIGASCNVRPNALSGGQPTDNDFASIYTHTTTLAMPVSLVSFGAQAQGDRTVLVNWKTSWERANKGYIVERSKDLKSFESVGEVTDIAGTSNSINSYRFVDKAPYRGTSYYRLRQVDLDGTSQTFKAESVVIDGKYGVYPNPVVSQQFTLDLDEPSQAVLHLYNASGSEVGINKLDPTEASTKVSTASKLSSGVYILTVEERGITRKHRLVVQ